MLLCAWLSLCVRFSICGLTIHHDPLARLGSQELLGVIPKVCWSPLSPTLSAAAGQLGGWAAGPKGGLGRWAACLIVSLPAGLSSGD